MPAIVTKFPRKAIRREPAAIVAFHKLLDRGIAGDHDTRCLVIAHLAHRLGCDDVIDEFAANDAAERLDDRPSWQKLRV